MEHSFVRRFIIFGLSAEYNTCPRISGRIFQTFPQRYAATVRMTIPTYEMEGMLWSVLVSETTPLHLISDGLAFNIYHVSPHETSDPNEFVTEVCYPVRRK